MAQNYNPQYPLGPTFSQDPQDGSPQLPQVDLTQQGGPMAAIAKILQQVQGVSQAQGGVGGNPVQQILAGIPTSKRDLAIQGGAALLPGLAGSLVKFRPALQDLAASVRATLPEAASAESTLAPTYFSNVEDAFSNPKIPQKLSREQAQAVLKSPGVKSDENKWLGMDELLRSKDKFTKDEILQHIRDNQIDVHEVTLGGTQEQIPKFPEFNDWMRQQGFSADPNETVPMPRSQWDGDGEAQVYRHNITGNAIHAANRTTDPYVSQWTAEQLAHDARYIPQEQALPKYSQYTLPGGSNYREVLLKWGNKPSELPDSQQLDDVIKKLYGPEHDWSTLGPDEFNHALAVRDNANPVGQPDFQSSHFDDPNILAHLRLTDRVTPDGKKLLFMEEAQSDWRNALQKQVVTQQDPTTSWDYQASKILHDKGLGEHAPLGPGAMETIENGITPTELRGPDTKTPDAPLARDYPSLVMKRVMRMAAEQGYDGVGWTTGQQQADRWKQTLMNGVDSLTYHPGDQTLGVGTPQGEFKTLQVPVSKLADTVGRENAQKLLEGVTTNKPPSWSDFLKTQGLSSGWDPNFEGGNWVARNNWGEMVPHSQLEQAFGDTLKDRINPGHLAGSDMSVGKTGYKDVYDTTLPKVADKIGRQFGARTQEGQIHVGVTQRPAAWTDVLAPDQPRLDVNRFAILRSRYPGLAPAEAADRAMSDPDRARVGIDNDTLFRLRHLARSNWGDNPNDVKIHTIPITPTLRSSALTRGFPLFQHAIGAVGLGAGGATLLQKYLQQQRDSQSPQN